MTPTAAQHLAEAVVADGFGAHRNELITFLAAARRRGVDRMLVMLVADDTESSIARLRALGRVVVEYSRHVESDVEHPPAPDGPAPRRELASSTAA